MSSSEDEPPSFTWSAETGSQSDSSSGPSPSTSEDGDETSRDGQQIWGEPDIHCSAAQWPVFDSDESDVPNVEPSKLGFNFKSLDKSGEKNDTWALSMRFSPDVSNNTKLGSSSSEPILISSTESSHDSEYEGHDDPRPGPSTSKAPDNSIVNFRAQANYAPQERRPVCQTYEKMYKEFMDRADASGPRDSYSSDESSSISPSDSSNESNSLPAVSEEYVELVKKIMENKSDDENSDHESDFDYGSSESDDETSESEESNDGNPEGVPSYVSISPHGSPPSPPSTDDESGYETDDGQYNFRLPQGAVGLVMLPAPLPGHDVFIAHAFGLDGNPLRNEAGGRNLHPGEVGEYRQEERQIAGHGLAGHVQLQGQFGDGHDENAIRALPIIPANPDQRLALANVMERNEPYLPVPAYHVAAHGRQEQVVPQAVPLVAQQRSRSVPVLHGRNLAQRTSPQPSTSGSSSGSSRRSCSTQTSRSSMSSPKPGPSTRPDSPLSRSSSLTETDDTWSSTDGGDFSSSSAESVFFSSGNEGAGDSIPYIQMPRERKPAEPTAQSAPRSGVTSQPVPSTSTWSYSEAKSSTSSGSSTEPKQSTSTGTYTLYGSALRLSQSTSAHTARAAVPPAQPSTSGMSSSKQRRPSPCDVEADDETSEDRCGGQMNRKVAKKTKMLKRRREEMTQELEARRLVVDNIKTTYEPCNKLPSEKRARSPTPCEASDLKKARIVEQQASSVTKHDESGKQAPAKKRKAEDHLGHSEASCVSSTKWSKIHEETAPSTSMESGGKGPSKKRKSDTDHEIPPCKKSWTSASGSSSAEDSSAETSLRIDSGFTDDSLSFSVDDIDAITASVLESIGEADEYILMP